MKILVLNCGSSSLKYQLINMENEEVIASGKFERIGEEEKEIVFVNNGTANLVFSYEGFNVNYEVTVKKKTETGLKAIYAKEGIFNILPNGVITQDLLRVFIEYEGIGEQFEAYSSSSAVSVTVDGVPCSKTSDGYVCEFGTNSSSRIVVKYLSYELTLDNSTYVVEV